MSAVGKALRATVFRPEKVRPVLVGQGRCIKLVVDAEAPLHKYVGTAEKELAPYIKRFASPGARCFDVGGYDGHLALTLARLTGAEVWCFEASAERVARIERNLELNEKLARHVRLLQTYVANETVEVPRSDTLDDLVASETFEPDFVKIDVEGAEMQVLTGATQLLRERKPHLLIEIHSARLALECLVHLEDVGYHPEPTIVPQRRWLKEHRGSARNEWIVAAGRDRPTLSSGVLRSVAADSHTDCAPSLETDWRR